MNNKVFVCTAVSDGEILGVEKVFQNEKDAAEYCKEQNTGRNGWFNSYTYTVHSLN